ncbi:dipicolinic acid synthetase subunit A [Evansella cellulosilytica]|uniref:Dipicolinic acid synthetase, A subunit n=1 Tax=Evansella cellulosilytica (strain ATCC 21833 / DSM 2522 / FERM P-1141 / JCM 9156 / N-4) TaxID=649639 RepID=E6TS49_EVAC2|nr:dipicolinic acid synthetase subunit A [Evansella cellulosilytica]ADU30703.1 dipicolinic acid synthetase, A subunit [Evansella cellulosilytica DSM 2522]
MLTDMHVAVIGGDARQLEIIRKLSEHDAQLSLVGFDQLDDGFVGANKRTFDTIDPSTVDAIILPVSGMNDNGEIESIFSGEKTVLTEDWLKETKDNTVVYTGISNERLKIMVNESGRKLVELMERDDVAIYNSVPTAEGTVMMVIQNTEITIHNANVIVTGLGRVGMTVARTFQNLGANVELIANEPNLKARAFEMGMKCSTVNDLFSRAESADVVINTIPAPIISPKVLQRMPLHALVVDLASKPGGTDFRYAEKRGIKALLAPGLPGIVAPKTAGEIIASVLSNLLQEQWDVERGGK